MLLYPGLQVLLAMPRNERYVTVTLHMFVIVLLSTALLVPAFGLFLAQRYWVGRRQYTTITGKVVLLSLMSWNIPMGYQTGIGRLKQIAPSLGEAASNLGAGSLKTFWDVELPLLKSSLVSAFVVSFIRAVTTLSVIVFLVTNRNAVATFTILNLANDGYRGAAAALTTALLTMTMLILGVSRLLFGKQVELFRI